VISKTENNREVGSTLAYSGFVERGTRRRRKARPYLEPAVLKHAHRFADELFANMGGGG
jgi:hypothetical protein